MRIFAAKVHYWRERMTSPYTGYYYVCQRLRLPLLPLLRYRTISDDNDAVVYASGRRENKQQSRPVPETREIYAELR